MPGKALDMRPALCYAHCCVWRMHVRAAVAARMYLNNRTVRSSSMHYAFTVLEIIWYRGVAGSIRQSSLSRANDADKRKSKKRKA
jgi:hypothetical protein